VTACPDLFAAELRARQRRQMAGRLRGLRARAAQVPLIASEIIERELVERADYYAAEPTERDRQVVAMRLAMASGAHVCIDDYLVQPWAVSGIQFSYAALAYRALAERVLPPLAVWQACCALARFRERQPQYGTHYAADHWHQALIAAGYRREAWEIHAATTDDPARERDFYERTWGGRRREAQAAPEQLALDLDTSEIEL
jgi:hypothetical protein